MSGLHVTGFPTIDDRFYLESDRAPFGLDHYNAVRVRLQELAVSARPYPGWSRCNYSTAQRRALLAERSKTVAGCPARRLVKFKSGTEHQRTQFGCTGPGLVHSIGCQ